MKPLNMNQLLIESHDGPNEPLEDFGTSSDGIDVYFKNLEQHLVRHILEADYVVGCVAWLTHPDILDALATTKGVSIIVQKEDWLRPDTETSEGWKRKLKVLYHSLPGTMTRYDEGFRSTVLHFMSCAGDPSIDAVRCVGNYNSTRMPNAPRSHHKFVVFCKETPETNEEENFQPYAVWTGSFNFTRNAVLSFENALVLRQPEIVHAYFCEYAQVAALSEPLNWDNEWSYPEWRIGT